MSGLAPGDTVYISGGPSGSTQVYDMDANGRPYPNFTTLNGFRNGTAGNRIVYTIGQDSAHNGKAIFSTTRGNHFLFKPKYIEFVGDAGDGEMHFALSGFSDLLVGDDSIAVRVAYFDCGEIGRFISCNSCTQMEVDHCYAKITDIHTPFAAYLLCTGSGFDDSSIHHCTILIPNSGGGSGTDGISAGGSGYSIHHNIITGYFASGANGDHQDGWQALGGSFIKVYGNIFTNIGNYPVYGDGLLGDFTHLWVYNNVMRLTDPMLQAADAPQAIAIGPDGGAFSYLGRYPTFTDVLVANNIIVDYAAHAAINLRNNSGQSSAFIGCSVKNNIRINSGGLGLDPAVEATNNAAFTAVEAAAGVFASYAMRDEGNDLHPTGEAVALVGQGTDLSAYFTTDADGALRTSPWDIGPYISGEPPTAVAPTFTLHPEDETATLGAVVLLTVTAAGVPAPILQWQKDGVDIDGATGATLVLAGVQPSDAGDYTCVATNSEGTATSDAATLTVTTPSEDTPGIYRFAASTISNPMILLPVIALLFLCAGCSTFRLPRIAIPGVVTVTAPKDAGKPATMASHTAEAGFEVPAKTVFTIARTEAMPARPAVPATATTEALPAQAAQPARETRTWEFPAPTAYHEKVQTVAATTGTIDTSVAMHAADNAERRILLWVAIAAAVAFVVLRGLVPAWPILSNSAGLIAALAFAAWKFSEVPEWILVAVAAVAILGALFYKRGEWDANGNGIPDALERKTTTTKPEPAETS